MKHLPLVSCIMPTHNRRPFVGKAIEYFLRQDYPDRELIIVDDGTDPIEDLVPDDPRIHYLRQDHKRTIGAKRNLACKEAQGEIIAHWDDDDWIAPWRLRYQVESLVKEQADICGLDKLLFYDPKSGQSWQYVYPERGRLWVAGGTLCYTKAFWKRNPFPDIDVGEDTRFVWSNSSKKVLALQNYTFYVALIHPGNISPKRASGNRWHSYRAGEIRDLMGEDWNFYAAPSQDGKAALVSAASGIGDILRITPLIRVFARLGYQVDVLLAPDYPEAITLLEGAPEIRHLFYRPSSWSGEKQQRLDGLNREFYDVAAFTILSLALQKFVRARRTFSFQRAQWLQEGDSACVETLAKEAGWEGPLPKPFVIPANRQFDLLPDTIALHPGAKPNWPWKRWHGFEELAGLLPEVAIIGTAADLQNETTYFRRSFRWPDHVRNFVGTLSLQDTTALLRKCVALVSNDSGMMHLGVAMGIPTFGIFGITNPEREAIPAENMFPISKGLPCEPACRQKPWGRRDCEYHLQCLKSLTPQEVFNRIRKSLPRYSSVDTLTTEDVPKPKRVKTMNELSMVYYGYVFDASGYGQAARAYIHALHKAGITLSVVDLSNRARQVRDELVESLSDRKITPDFHFFHGIPPQWARLAFRLPNTVGMTVWETDSMPTQWRNILNHVLEVWLPSEFNLSVFGRALETPIFKLPHPVFPPQSDGKLPDLQQILEITRRDFVFYSLFEWQDRKCPVGLVESYLRAFPTERDTLLMIKANPGAAHVARQAIEEARQRVPSEARVVIRCEAWSEAQIEALHGRGDCYVSLHRGEGWGYPLFEAAGRGTPVIATGYSGPLDYLNPQAHCLVEYELTQVRQRYVYYHPRMRWAEPDFTHAAERMRWVYEHRKEAKERAAKAAEKIQQAYSLESVGIMAKDRLLQLLKRTQPKKWQRLMRTKGVNQLSPAIPIPGAWFDEDYFEHGVKSNWDQGYSWSLFAGLFRDTATFLTSIFSEADSFLDIGCAKGFLVRALRECGKECWGFDHSPWAINHAEECVKPFVTLAHVDDVNFDRFFDILLALNIFEKLTEVQIVSFLSRAHSWTQTAIFAVIPSFQSEAEKQLYEKDDHDLSHITLRAHQWWHELFLRTGWRQDPLHRVVEQLCQSHELPKKMGWEVYVYVPD